MTSFNNPATNYWHFWDRTISLTYVGDNLDVNLCINGAIVITKNITNQMQVTGVWNQP